MKVVEMRKLCTNFRLIWCTVDAVRIFQSGANLKMTTFWRLMCLAVAQLNVVQMFRQEINSWM